MDNMPEGTARRKSNLFYKLFHAINTKELFCYALKRIGRHSWLIKTTYSDDKKTLHNGKTWETEEGPAHISIRMPSKPFQEPV